MGCGKSEKSCPISTMILEKTFESARKDQVDIILMAQELAHVQDTETIKTVSDQTLEAFKLGILTCLPAGNNGPMYETLAYGMPWCINVGACTRNLTLVTEVEIAVNDKENPKRLRTAFVQGKQLSVIQTMKGISYHLVDSAFYELRFNKKVSETEDCVLTLNKKKDQYILVPLSEKHRKRIIEYEMCNSPLTFINKVNCSRLVEVCNKYSQIYVRLSRSKYEKDLRQIHVPEFSGRGPSLTFPEIIMPDVVAPGQCILASCPTNSSTTSSSSSQMTAKNQMIDTGTSSACSHVAGATAYIKHCKPSWGPSTIKSALVTTVNLTK